VDPGFVAATAFRNWLLSTTALPLNWVTTSPCFSPARAAGEPSSTLLTSAPRVEVSPNELARSGVIA
jgi:hypothetical protein